MTKSSYKEAFRKHTVRDALMSITQPYRPTDKLVGLAGPDIQEYIKWCNKYGYSNIEVYETNFNVMFHQLKTFGTIAPIGFHYTDILQAPYEENTFYDLDFCGSVRYLDQHINKFKSNFMMTFSTRLGLSQTVDGFMDARGEKDFVYLTHRGNKFTYNLIDSYYGDSYLMVRYKDTSPMCIISDVPEEKSHMLHKQLINLNKQQNNY
jgi:hypothetical protein